MKKNKSLTSAISISLFLHIVLLIALVWGADFTMSKPKPTSNIMQAVVIDPALVRQQANEIREKRKSAANAEQERLDKLRKQSEQLEKNRKEEEERIRRLKEDKAKADKEARDAEKRAKAEQEKLRIEQQKLKAEQELAAKAEIERKRKQEEARKAEQERIAKEAAAAKAEAERVEREKAAKEAQEKARQEQQRLEQLEKERQEQEAALGDIFAGLEAEAAQNSSAKQQFITSELDRYGAIYKQLIQSNLLMEDAFRGKSCRVNLNLLPAGNDAILSSVEVLSGDSRLCAATKRAVAQVRSYPLPTDKDIVSKLRNINLTVAPE